MTALTADRATDWRDGHFTTDPVEAGKKIFAGALVVLNAAGNAQPGTTALALVARGRAEHDADNTLGIAGAITVTVRHGVLCYNNDGSITRANIGSTCYIVDDNTVAATNGTNTRSAAGTILDLGTDGVWVEIG